MTDESILDEFEDNPLVGERSRFTKRTRAAKAATAVWLNRFERRPKWKKELAEKRTAKTKRERRKEVKP